jgi:hypothetical protein
MRLVKTFAVLFLGSLAVVMLAYPRSPAAAPAPLTATAEGEALPTPQYAPPISIPVEVLMNGTPLQEYDARGKRYVEATEGAEYELRIHNPFGERVAVALSVDGLNTIDARRSTAWDAKKWVIDPYGSITISGWQMSSSRARHFYFTTEQNSYGAKLGQTANLGVISAVLFRERPRVATVTPQTREQNDERSESRPSPSGSSPQSGGRADSAKSAPSEQSYPMPARPDKSYPVPDDESAATGIGRNVRHDVYWITMDLDPSPVADVTIRYEYRAALVRLGILPRDYREDPLKRRERSSGFENREYSPEP